MLFQTPAVEPSAASVANLTAEDAHLDSVAVALKYGFGFSAFKGEQQVQRASLSACVPAYGGLDTDTSNAQHVQLSENVDSSA